MPVSALTILAAAAALAADTPAPPEPTPLSTDAAAVATVDPAAVEAYDKPIGPPVAVPPRPALFAATGPAEVVQIVNAAQAKSEAAANAGANRTGAAAAAGAPRHLFPSVAALGRRIDGMVEDYKQPSWDDPEWYWFAGSDGQAMTWKPRGEHELRLQDRPVVGELQAGLSYQTGPVQASIAYMEHEVSNSQRSDRQGFGGVSVTVRR